MFYSFDFVTVILDSLTGQMIIIEEKLAHIY